MAKLNVVVTALIAGNLASLVTAFESVSMDDLKVARNTFNQLYSDLKAKHETAAADAEKLAAERAAELQKTIADIQAAVSGLDLDVVTKLANEQMAKKYPQEVAEVKPAKAWTQDRVKVSVDGEVFEIPVRGNTTPGVRAKIQEAVANGQTREEWIEAHRVAE